jgi:hypothetical protein
VSGHNWGNRLEVSGGVALTDSRRSALRNEVSPEFFETYGQRLIAGRAFTDRDRDGSPLVAIVNEAMASNLEQPMAAPFGRREEVRRGHYG